MNASSTKDTDRPTWDQLDALVKLHKLNTLSTMDTAALIWNLTQRSDRAETEQAGVEKAALYCEQVLAGHHPHLAHAYRHAAYNMRAFALFSQVIHTAPSPSHTPEPISSNHENGPAVPQGASPSRHQESDMGLSSPIPDGYAEWKLLGIDRRKAEPVVPCVVVAPSKED